MLPLAILQARLETPQLNGERDTLLFLYTFDAAES